MELGDKACRGTIAAAFRRIRDGTAELACRALQAAAKPD
jgi:hypothetical protein